MGLGGEGVEDERVDGAVPRDVHEPDQRLAVAGRDPAEAVPVELADPVVVEHPVMEALGVEPVDLVVGESPRHS